jgi:hypothetical protein
VIDASPHKVLLAIPCMDGRIWAECMLSIIQTLSVSGGQVTPFVLTGDSNICHARNSVAHYFLTKTDCDTLFFLDSDIAFSPSDFAAVLDGQEQVVIAPYARKVFGMEPVGFGMGFCRIHRSVFQTLSDMTDSEGQEALPRYFYNGEVATHFFFTGASPDARWFSEDTGFWHWCALNGITQRLERRTRLGHIGFYKYECPNQIPDHVTPYRGNGPYPDLNPVQDPKSIPVDSPGPPELQPPM